MTWQGGKRPREEDAGRTFAPLRRLLEEAKQDPAESFEKLAQALNNYDAPMRIHVRLLKDEGVEHWEIKGGSSKSVARQKEPKDADVLVVVRRDTWIQMMQGRLSPFDAIAEGNLRVGGNLEVAKRLAQHLSDPEVPFVAPC